MRGYLFDTSALLLAGLDHTRFKARHREVLTKNPRFVSQVCAIEIAIKHSIGRLSLPPPFQTHFVGAFQAMVKELSADVLDIDLEAIAKLSRLPLMHRDPFDRIIIAQAFSQDLTVVTSDRAFAAYAGLEILEI